MIDKSKAQKDGIKTIDSSQALTERRDEKLQQLKALLPEVVNSDGAVDINALKDWVGAENTVDPNNRGYTLNFAGKGLAKTMADIPTDKELKVEQAQSKNFDDTENIVLRGDNIDALKLLKQNYEGRIKMIYIDPPYNTTSENFIYDDNFRQTNEDLIEGFGLAETTLDYLSNIYGTRTHSGWLAFMYPRLKLARDLLSDDGVIFVSIDDNEQANLKLICDEIFGEENFVENFCWNKTQTPPSLSKKTRKDIDYVLCYEKNRNDMGYFGKPSANSDAPLLNKGNERKELLFPPHTIHFNIPDGEYPKGTYGDIEIPQNILVENQKNETEIKMVGEFRWGQSNLKEELKLGTYFIIKKETMAIRYKKRNERVSATTPAKFIKAEDAATNESASKELMELRIPFEFAKPYELIKYLLKMIAYEDKAAIVLDFFAGSGTTGDAVMHLNAEDGGKRKFILVQLDEGIDKKKSLEAHNFCTENKFPPVISSITLERLNRAGEKIKDGLEKAQGEKMPETQCPDIGYKVFSLQPRPEIPTETSGQLSLKISRRSEQDTLYNMLSASGKPLHHPVEPVEEKLLYRVDGAYYVLGECKTDITEYVDNPIYFNGYADYSVKFWVSTERFDKDNLTVIY